MKKIVSLCIVLVVLISVASACFAETASYGHLISETEDIQFFLVDGSNYAEQLEIRIRVEPKNHAMFPFPIGTILPDRRTDSDAYLSTIIGKNIAFNGFSPEEQGLTMAQYLELKEKAPIWFDLLLIDQGEPYFSYIKMEWIAEDDGSVFAKCIMRPSWNEEQLTVRCYYGSFDADSLKTHFDNGGGQRPPDQNVMLNIPINRSSMESFSE